MQLHLQPPASWQQTNDLVAENLGVDEKRVRVQVYQGLPHALVEACVGLQKLFPLKKKLYYFKSQSPYFDRALMPLAKDGLQLVALDDSILANPEPWAATLVREDLFVLYAADDPFLGQKFELSKFEKCLADKLLVRIKVSHADHFYNRSDFAPARNAIHIFSLGIERAISFLGERCRVGSVAAQELVWPEASNSRSRDALFQNLIWYKNQKVESTSASSTRVKSDANVDYIKNMELITSFEQGRPAGGTPIFKPDALRLYDRAVLYWEDMEGSAFIERLQARIAIDGASDHALNSSGDIESDFASLSLIGGKESLVVDYLQKAYGISPEASRGLIAISYKWIARDTDLVKKMVQVRDEILKDQFGEISV